MTIFCLFRKDNREGGRRARLRNALHLDVRLLVAFFFFPKMLRAAP